MREASGQVMGLQRQEAKWLLILAVASIVAGLLIDFAVGRAFSLSPESIRNWLDGLGFWAPLIYMVILAVAVVVSPIPSVPLDIAAGLAFGLFWGVVYTLIGAEVGGLVAFGLARWLGRPWLARRLPPAAMSRIDALAERLGGRALLVMRLLPVFNFDWVSYAAGLTTISTRVFAIATFVGMIPPVIAIVAVGAILPTRPGLSAAIFAGLVLMVFIPVLAALLPWRKRSTPRDQTPA
ncbi:MAG TPA: TVP38/TMEM64 family protein [Thermomicrobiales bacterium]|nr:TVP38/TMEM64 family protein [Thermomicrobiales bacterium]